MLDDTAHAIHRQPGHARDIKSLSCPTLFTFPATQLIPLAYASSSSSSSVVRPVMSGSSLSMAASIAARFFSCSRRIFLRPCRG